MNLSEFRNQSPDAALVYADEAPPEQGGWAVTSDGGAILGDPDYKAEGAPPQEYVVDNTQSIDIPSGFGIPPADQDEMAAYSEQSNALGGFWSGFYSSDHANLGRVMEAVSPRWVRGLTGRLYLGDIPWTPEKESWLTHKTTTEVLGITEEEWDALSVSERIKLIHDDTQQKVREGYNPDVASAAYLSSKFAGSLASPTTALAWTAPKALAALGAVDASLYQYGTEGELSPYTPAVGAALGYAGGKLIQKMQRGQEEKQARQIYNQLQAEIHARVIDGANPITAVTAAKEALGLTDDVVRKSTTLLDRKLVAGRTSAIEAAGQGKAFRQGRFSGATGIDKLIEPISESIKRISPRLYGRLQQTGREAWEESHKDAMLVEPFLKKAFKSKKLLNKDDQSRLHLMMLNSKSLEDVATIERFLRAKGGESFVKDYRTYRGVLKRLRDLRQAAGEKLSTFPGHHPRRVGDYDEWFKSLPKSERSRIDSYLKREAEKLGTTVDQLSKKQRTSIYNKFLGTPDNKRSIETITSAHQRKVPTVSKELERAYQDPWDTTHAFIKESRDLIEKRQVFGDSLKKTKDGADIDLEGTIGSFIAKERAAGRLKGSDVDELKRLLNLRFVYGPQQMNKSFQHLKNLGYMSLLGHPTNAVRQLSDLSLSGYKNGIINTTKGAIETLTRSKLTAKEAGMLDNVATEFASNTWSKRGVDAVFKYSGFRAIDALGKGTHMNASLNKSMKLLKTKAGELEFRNKWSSVLGPEDTSKLIKEFRAFKKGDKPTRLMKDTAFMDLAQIQPITLLEMPELYLKHPNGRMLYMLKSFMLKHVNLIRQDVIKEATQGSKTKAIKNAAVLSSYFTLGNMGVDKINDLILGRDRKLEETFIVNLYRNTGLLSKYDVEQIARTGEIYDFAIDYVAPPLDPLAKGSWAIGKAGYNLSQGKAWNYEMSSETDVYEWMPLFGRLAKAWLGDD